ncbi:MAG: hypothetical protein QG622_2720 [Actinomycetota bacterium]|nr:hypothetical protein [Actinomycetota bacterium]
MNGAERALRILAPFALPEHLRWLFAYRDILSNSDADGIVVLDAEGKVRTWSEGARRLLGTSVPLGDPVNGAGLTPAILHLIRAGEASETASPVVVRGRSLRIVRRPVSRRERIVGQAVLIHDETETARLTAQLRAERETTIALRARAHEADNHLHTVVSLVELGHAQEAVDFATAVLARSREIRESIHSTVADPILAALLMGKAASSNEAGVALHVDPSTTMPQVGLPSQDLVLILGNLIDNGIDAAAVTPPPRWVHVLATATASSVRLQVSDSGPGLPPGFVDHAFTAGWTTKNRTVPGEAHGQGLGLALVSAAVHRLGGTITVDRWVGARFVVEIPLAHDTTGADTT